VTTTIAVPAGPDGAPAARGRWRKVAVVGACVLLVAAIGTGLGFWRYAAAYAPLNPGGFFGPYGNANLVKIGMQDTDLGEEFYVKGPAGTQAAVITALANDGSHDVVIQRIESNPLIANIAWSRYVLRPGGNVTGVRLPLRSLPASIPAHSRIRVVITLRKPRCANRPIVNLDQLVVHWHALGVDHAYQWPFADGTTYVGCPLHIH
jgi:hypothetical protein